MTRGTKGMAVAVALSAVAMLGACSKGDNTAADTSAMAATAGDSAGMMNNAAGTGATTSMNASTSMPAGTETMTDAEIFSMLASANQGEIDAGKTASTKATNPTVKAFAKDMVTDHTMLMKQGMALANKLNVAPKPMANDSVMAMNQMVAAKLSSAPQGMGFDSTYVNTQINGHQAVLDLIKKSEGEAQNAELKTMLQNAEPIIQRHLDRIKDIQGKMK